MNEHLASEGTDQGRALPVVMEAPSPRPSLARCETTASFISQLLAERAHLATQRAKRRGSVGDALSAYRTGANAAVLRMPQGYRKSVLV